MTFYAPWRGWNRLSLRVIEIRSRDIALSPHDIARRLPHAMKLRLFTWICDGLYVRTECLTECGCLLYALVCLFFSRNALGSAISQEYLTISYSYCTSKKSLYFGSPRDLHALDNKLWALTESYDNDGRKSYVTWFVAATKTASFCAHADPFRLP